MTAWLTPLRALALLIAFAAPGLLHAQDARSYSGQAHNVTVGVRAGVEIQIVKDGGGYTLSAQFDNITLAGTATGTGRPPLYDDGQAACAEGHECLLFAGEIALGPDAGFANGTVTTFTLSLDIESASGAATGVYQIGLLPGFGFEQYGILTLAPLSS